MEYVDIVRILINTHFIWRVRNDVIKCMKKIIVMTLPTLILGESSENHAVHILIWFHRLWSC